MKNCKIDIRENDILDGVEIVVENKEASCEEKGGNSLLIKLVLGAIIGFVNGFWGGGGGMICVPLLTQIIKLPDKKAHATTLLIMLPLSLASLIIYITNSNMLWWEGLKIGVGFVLGGILGALLLKKISNKWLCAIFSIIIIVGGIKLII